MPRVLLVVRSDNPSKEAYHVIRLLKENGYSIDICSSKLEPSKSERIKSDFVLDDSMSPKQYEGVVFLDDGGDEQESVRLAKESDKLGIAVGGYGMGAVVLDEAGLLKDKQVSYMLPFKPEKAELVNVPAVRCENVVTSAEGCAEGFVVVFVDALGGEVKKIVKGGDEPVPALTAMVVSRLARWPEYWGLANRLSSMGIGLVIADWFDVDVKNKRISKALVLKAPFMPRFVPDLPIPSSSWFKQTSIGTEETILAVMALESAGVRNVNSSSALRMSSNKMSTADAILSVCDQGNPVRFSPNDAEEAAEMLLSAGVKWVKPLSGSLGEKIMRVMGHGGDYAIVSKRFVEEAKHYVITRDDLPELIRRQQKGDFIVQQDIGEMRAGNHTGELRFIMRKRASGWKCSCEMAKFGVLLSNPSRSTSAETLKSCTAAQACELVFGDEWQDRLEDARKLAHDSCIAFQSSLDDPSGVSELAVDITFSDGSPKVIEVNGIPDLTFVDEAFRSKDKLAKFSRRIGHGHVVYLPMGELELERSRADMDEPLAERIDDDTYFVSIRQELSKLGIHFQRDGKVIIGDGDKISYEDAVKQAQEEALEYIDLLRSIQRSDEAKEKKFRKLVLMRVHKLCLLREHEELRKRRKKATTASTRLAYDNQPTGPYQYISDMIGTPTPYEQNETSDYDPVKMELNRPRRHPEYFYGWKFRMWLPGTPQEDAYSIDSLEKLINEGGSCYPFIASNWE